LASAVQFRLSAFAAEFEPPRIYDWFVLLSIIETSFSIAVKMLARRGLSNYNDFPDGRGHRSGGEDAAGSHRAASSALYKGTKCN
jgi:hypothetical protein